MGILRIVIGYLTGAAKILRRTETILGLNIEEDPTDTAVTDFASLLPLLAFDKELRNAV